MLEQKRSSSTNAACPLPSPPDLRALPSLLLPKERRRFLALPHGLPSFLPCIAFIKSYFSVFSLISCFQGHLSIIMGGDGEYFPQTLFYLSNGCSLRRLAEVTHVSTGIATAPSPNNSWPSDTTLGCEMGENNTTSFRI